MESPDFPVDPESEAPSAIAETPEIQAFLDLPDPPVIQEIPVRLELKTFLINHCLGSCSHCESQAQKQQAQSNAPSVSPYDANSVKSAQEVAPSVPGYGEQKTH